MADQRYLYTENACGAGHPTKTDNINRLALIEHNNDGTHKNTINIGTVKWASGAGTPEGAVTAPVGSMYTRTDGGAGTTLYVKESGTGNTGWVAK